MNLKDRRLKVAIVIDGLGVGGISSVCLNYIQLLLNLNCQIDLINLSPSEDELETSAPKGVCIFNIPFPRKLAPEQYTQLVKKNLFLKILYPFVYSFLLILNYFYKLFCIVKYKCCRKNYDLVIAFSSHFNDLTFVSTNFVNANKKMAWCHGAIYEYLFISDGFINLYNKITNIVSLVHEDMREIFLTNRQLRLKVNTLYNPTLIKDRKIDIDTVEALKRKYGKFLLMVARFDYPYKDPFTVIKAFEILNEKYGYNDLQLVFVGDGTDLNKAKEYLKKISKRSQEKIHFVGKRLDVQNFYKAASVYVQAGAATEGLPTTMIEAMAFSLPQVITDVKVGPREILGNNKYGLLCEPQNPKSMADKINSLLSNADLYKHYQLMESKRWHDFMPETVQEKLKYVLGTILNNEK